MQEILFETTRVLCCFENVLVLVREHGEEGDSSSNVTLLRGADCR